MKVGALQTSSFKSKQLGRLRLILLITFFILEINIRAEGKTSLAKLNALLSVDFHGIKDSRCFNLTLAVPITSSHEVLMLPKRH